MLLAYAIIWQLEAPTLYLQYAVQSGIAPFTSGFINRDAQLLRFIVPFTILFYSCLWAVKISLLLFFRRLGSNVNGQRIWWWSIFVVTVLAWVACIGDLNWRCSLGSYYWIYVTCKSSSSLSLLANAVKPTAIVQNRCSSSFILSLLIAWSTSSRTASVCHHGHPN